MPDRPHTARVPNPVTLIEPLEDRRLLATFTVTSTGDTVANDGQTTLREAVQSANATASADTIVFASVFDVQRTILLAGELDVTAPLTIDTQGKPVTIAANNNTRLLNVAAGTSLAVRGGRLVGGGAGTASTPGNAALTAGGAIRGLAGSTIDIDGTELAGNSATDGGAIWTQGALTIDNALFHENSASDSTAGATIFGGAINALGALTISNSTIEFSAAGDLGDRSFGGAVAAGAPVQISDTTIIFGSAKDSGGSLYLAAGGTITGGRIADSDAELGGGIAAFGTLTLNDVRLENNEATVGGGGIYSDRPLTIVGGAVTLNTSGDTGGGVLALDSLTLDGVGVTGNAAAFTGGGIYHEPLGGPAAAPTLLALDAGGGRDRFAGKADRPDLAAETAGRATRLMPARPTDLLRVAPRPAPVRGLESPLPAPVPGATLTIDRGVITGNTSAGVAGVDVLAGGANVTETRIADNTATGTSGSVAAGVFPVGGLSVIGDLSLERSEISGNAASGPTSQTVGGLAVEADLGLGTGDVAALVLNSTVSGNAGDRAGVSVTSRSAGNTSLSAVATFVHATVAGNAAPSTSGDVGGVGLDAIGAAAFAEASFANSILSANTAGGAVSNVATTEDGVAGNDDDDAFFVGRFGGSVFGTDLRPTLPDASDDNEYTDDPGLAALADNGGPTRTRALTAGSVARDVGRASLAVDPGADGRPATADDVPLGSDQRPGSPRVVGPAPDAGAFEAGGGDTTAPTLVSGEFVFDTVTDPSTRLGDHQFRLTFSEDVSASLSLADLTVLNLDTNRTFGLAGSSLSFDAAGTVATVLLADRLDDGDFTVTLDRAGVTDASGNALSGPASFGDFWLANDVNRDRRVNARDLLVVRRNLGDVGNDGLFSRGDVNFDGRVNARDLLAIRRALGDVL